MKVFIIGQGYVGLSISVAASTVGHDVTGYDTNNSLIQSLISSRSQVEGISDKKLYELQEAGCLSFTNDASDMSKFEIIIIAVPTPLDSGGRPDLTFLQSASDLVIAHTVASVLIINESTSHPGTLRDEIAGRVERGSNIAHEYATAPERIDPGNTKFNVRNTPRVVAGLTEKASQLAYKFYSSFCDYVTIVESPEIAETAKLLENTFRQVNIALVNQLAVITEKLGISIHSVIEAAATKPFGFMKFSPGLGVGGHCIPVDPTYLLHVAKDVGVPATFIELANAVNKNMVNQVIEIIEQRIGKTLGKERVCVVGLSYKANVVDLRESPSLHLISQLKKRGSVVTWHDSVVKQWNEESSSEVSKDDIAIIAVVHSELDLEKLRCAKYVFDCTGQLSEFATF